MAATGAIVEFQFHFGTIKTWCAFYSFIISLISIPLWYDKNTRRHSRRRAVPDFNSTLVR